MDDDDDNDDASTWGMDNVAHLPQLSSTCNDNHQQITDLGTGSHRLTINYSILQQ